MYPSINRLIKKNLPLVLL